MLSHPHLPLISVGDSSFLSKLHLLQSPSRVVDDGSVIRRSLAGFLLVLTLGLALSLAGGLRGSFLR